MVIVIPLLIVNLVTHHTPIMAQSFQTNNETYHLVREWGLNGISDRELSYPIDIALDSTGNVFVTDFSKNQIQKLDMEGNFITNFWLNDTEGKFSSSVGIDLDSSNNVYVADSVEGIKKFDQEGDYVKSWHYYRSPGDPFTGQPDFGAEGRLILPHDVAIDSMDNVYTTYYVGILKFDSNGNFITEWGSNGTGLGQFISPDGIAIDSQDNIYVSDHDMSRIQKFDSDGNFIKMWNYTNVTESKLGHMDFMTVDTWDNVYLADANNHRVQKFDSNGNFITEWSTTSLESSQFDESGGIVVDISGKVYLVDSTNSKIQVFTQNASPINEYSLNLFEGITDQL
jgi:streptogramin lyase